MKTIKIYFDYSPNIKIDSFNVVLQKIENNEPEIHTHCLNFFSFEYLNKGYEVAIVRSGGFYINLSELLTDRNYCDKEIRKTHNVYKMLLAGALKWKIGV